MSETRMKAIPVPRVLAADIYDTLELASLAFGGVGRKRYFADEDSNSWNVDHSLGVVPCCIQGMAMYATNAASIFENEISRAFRACHINSEVNDAIFAKGEGRIPFSEWCRRLNVVRGEDSPRSTP